MNESPTRQNRTAILFIAIFSSFAAPFCLLSGLWVRYVIVFQLLFLIFGALILHSKRRFLAEEAAKKALQ